MAPSTVSVVEIQTGGGGIPRVIAMRPRTETTYGEVYAKTLDVAEGRRILTLQDADDGMVFGRGTSIHINPDSYYLGEKLRNMPIQRSNVRVLVSKVISPEF